MNSRTILWIIGLVVLIGLFIYAGLNITSGEPFVQASTDESIEPVVAEQPDPQQPATNPEVTIMTEDDRPSRLRTATASWNTNWNKHTIQYDELLSGGPPRDGIPSIDDPKFVSPGEADGWLADNEPVIALEIDGDARAYPLQILTWHEIVNDTIGGVPVATAASTASSLSSAHLACCATQIW